jgi:hypothetical protein
MMFLAWCSGGGCCWGPRGTFGHYYYLRRSESWPPWGQIRSFVLDVVHMLMLESPDHYLTNSRHKAKSRRHLFRVGSAVVVVVVDDMHLCCAAFIITVYVLVIIMALALPENENDDHHHFGGDFCLLHCCE